MSYDFQHEFLAALAEEEKVAPAFARVRNGASLSRRFAVYRDKLRQSLVDALASTFPAARRLVGRQFFVAMADAFATARPPRSPLLLAYGAEFPAFIESFAPAESLPYLADVARVEWARALAYHAADAAPLAAETLARLAPDDLLALRLKLHPSATVLSSPHPAATLWAMNAGEQPPGPLEFYEAESCLILRPRLAVELRRLAPGGAEFLAALGAGAPLAEAAEAGAAEAHDFDLVSQFSAALQAGAFASLEPGAPRHDIA